MIDVGWKKLATASIQIYDNVSERERLMHLRCGGVLGKPKKVPPLVVRQPLPPSSLAVSFFSEPFLKLQKKLFLGGPAFTPRPLLVVGPLVEELFMWLSLSCAV